MQKISFRKSTKVLRVLVLLPFFAQTFISPILALEELIPKGDTSVIEVDIPIDTSEDILDEGIATGPEEDIVEPEIVELDVLVPEEEVEPIWLENGYIAITNDVVVLGEVYIAPQNGAVSLTFTKLPEESGYLTIKEITLTDEEVEATGAISNIAYDITTDMVDGTYEYDLTLPTTSDDIDVIYVESREELLNGGTEVNEKVIVENGKVEIEGLEHFTVFVIVDDGDTDFSAPGWSSHSSGYDNDHKWVTPSQAGKTATWTYTGSSISNSAIFISWTQWNDHATNATYKSSLFPPVIVDQKLNSTQVAPADGNGIWSEWYRVPGNYALTNGSTVTLSTNDLPNGNLSADAISFVDLDETPSEVWVDDDYSLNDTGYHFWGYDAFDNLQDAINAVANNGIVNVATGTYTDDIWDASKSGAERYRIKKSIILLGAQSGNDPAGSTDRGNESILVRTNGVPYSLYAPNITIDGFMLGSSAPNTGGKLIISDNADNTVIRNCIIQNTPSASSGHGVYIYPGADNALVEYNTFFNTAWEAIASWQVSNAVISHNYISASGQHAIQFMGHSGSNNEISYNHISGIVGTNAIQYWGGPGANIHHNVIDGSNTMYDGIWLDSAADDSTVNNNQVFDLIYAGINVRGGNSGSIVNFNQIYDNGTGLVNYDSNIVDAKNNWWGDTTGPLDNINTDGSIPLDNLSGLGNSVSGTVDYSEWAVNSDFTFNVPTNLGWNLRSKSNTPDERPVDIACEEITNADYQAYGDGKISHNWEPAETISNLKYQREWMSPGSSTWTTDGGVYTNAFTPFSTFGSATGTEGEWNTRVRAWVDVNGNGALDEGIDTISDWSNDCKVTYDRTVPIKPIITNSPDNSFTNINAITIDWTEGNDQGTTPSGIKGYILRYVFTPANGSPDKTWNTGLREVGNPQTHSGTYGHGEGKYVIYVKTLDNAGNESQESDSFTITYDITPPNAPEGLHILDFEGTDLGCGGYTNNRNITIDWDDNSEGDVDFYILDLKDKDHHRELDISEYDARIRDIDDFYKYKIRVVDFAGNISDPSVWCGVTLDRIAPEVEITTHLEDQVVSGLQTISGDISDLNLSHYWFVVVNSSGIKMAGPGTVNHNGPTTTKSFNWDTTGVIDGIYTIKLEARDKAGNKDPNQAPLISDPEVLGDSVDWIRVIVDNTAPVSIFDTDLSGQFFNGNIMISGQSLDDNNVAGVELFYKLSSDSIWTSMTNMPNSNLNNNPYIWSYQWDPVVDGTYDIKASAYDLLGNTENSPMMLGVIFDTTPPNIGSVRLTIDYVGKYVNGLTGFWGKTKVTDSLSGVDRNSCEYTIDGSTWSQGSFSKRRSTCSFHIGQLPDAEALAINVRMADKANNLGSGIMIARTADTFSPRVNVNIPEDFYGPNTFLPNSTIQGEASDTVSDITTVKVSMKRDTDGKYWRKSLFGGSYAWRSHSIRLNSVQGTNIWTYTGIFPTFQNGATYTVTPYAWDEVHIIPGTGAPDSFTWDSEAPTVPVLESPIGGIHIKDNTPLMQWADSSDGNGSGMKGYYYRVYYNCSDENDIPNSCSSLYPNTTGLWRTGSEYQAGTTVDGTYYWQVMAVDNVGNESDWSGLEEVTIDMIPADITWDTPIDGSIHKSSVVLSAHTNETMNNLRFKWQLDGESWDSGHNINLKDTSYSYTFDPIEDGVYHLRAQGQDLAKNWSKATDITITIDRIAPVVGITDPTDNDFVKGSINISGFVTDINLSHYNISIYPGGVDVHDFSLRLEGQTVYGPEFTDQIIYTWDTTGYADGEYQIRLAARDLAGNRELNGDSEDVITVTVDNTKPDRPTGLRRLLASDHNVVYECGDYSQIQGMHPDWNDSSDINFDYFEYTSFNAPNGAIGLNEKRFDESIFEYNGSWLPNEGTYGFAVRAIDKAGNISDWALTGKTLADSCQITYDKTPPVIQGHEDVTLTEGDLFPTDVVTLTDENPLYQVCAQATDLTGTLGSSGYGCVSVNEPLTNDEFPIAEELRLKIEAWQGNPFTHIDLDVLPEGQYEISYYATDMAGNESEVETFIATIVNNPPTILVTPPSTTVTVGDPAVVLSTTVTNGNAPFTYEWTGDCTGTGDTNTVSTDTAGTYTCTVQVTDDDGDISTSQATVTVVAPPAVLGATTGPSTGTGGYFFASSTGTGNGEEAEEEPEEETTEEDEEEVLGESTCETTYKISGTVFYDKNDDGIYDDNEKGVKGIDVKIYDTEGNLVKTVQTDDLGNWEAYLCPGEYSTEVEDAEDQEFTLGESDMTLDIPVEKKFPWWWILIAGTAVLVLLAFFADRYKKYNSN